MNWENDTGACCRHRQEKQEPNNGLHVLSANPAFAGSSVSASRLFLANRRGQFWDVLNVRFGSLAELNDTPKAAAQAAGIGGKAEVAIAIAGAL